MKQTFSVNMFRHVLLRLDRQTDK